MLLAANSVRVYSMSAKTLKFLPLTFAAGPWGFVVFVPYLIGFLAISGIAVYVARPRV
jgi:hypothetical protein